MSEPPRFRWSWILLPVLTLGALWLGLEHLPGWLAPAPVAPPTERNDPLDQVAARGLFPGGLPAGMRLEALRHDGEAWGATLSSVHLPPIDELKPLLRRAREAGWEAHATAVGSTGAELRLYADGRIALRAEVRPERQPLQQAGAAPTTRERPLIAVVVHNLGDDDAARLVEVPLPLGLAVLPYRPHGPRIAREAVKRGHEVLLDLPRAEAGSPEARAAALAAVPWVSGVLVIGRPPASLPPLPFGAFLSDAGAEGQRRAGEAGYRPVDVLVAADPIAGLAEAQRLAQLHGAATIVIDAKHGALREVLDWAAHRAEADGFRLALPGEVARLDEVVGRVSLPAAAPAAGLGPAPGASPLPSEVRDEPAGAPTGPTSPRPIEPVPITGRDLGTLELNGE
ncbi:MAG: divergent polysaccharide deacetylase family protein [Deltaproteobacteria bacterium]|nr:divergent polysaccharide deacetylase family protein [Deltaproteobacteria bacterium]